MTKSDLIPEPVSRNLRIFAFDPGLSARFETAGIGEITIAIPWEKNLLPGPVGDYIEVIDADPASSVVYKPVDLNDPRLLAQNGLSPSESNPQFHQQMAYAVAMATIGHFEQALGRVALWSSHRPTGTEEQVVRRLRIYPHALRDRNAFYSPEKKALLFGYFPVGVKDAYNTPGTVVFTCLSHDIVAHETTHALLDGVHPRFNEPVNLDVLAFHEAFADIVALFQHFSYPGVLRDQIARTRGNLANENLLGQLAQQFGKASGRGRALRDALGKVNRKTGAWEPLQPDVRALDKAREPHARGAIMVAAVFASFLKVYWARTVDLYRIASEGTGVLREGEIHPDLANRLADEAARAAQPTLQMCIRAIDYCPPLGITFGDYLRAIVTADFDFKPAGAAGVDVAAANGERLIPPPNGATVRFYRTGHGDCFLLGFAGDDPAKPVYVLIDCGYKPGSPKFINTKIKDITKSIRDATGGHIHVAVITHEHQDHVNGITEANFKDITIGQTWLAWTENPEDDLANALCTRFNDQLRGLLAARNRLTAAGDVEQVKRLDEFLSFELGGDDEQFNAAAAQAMLRAAGGEPANSMNKRSMKLFKDRAKNGVEFLRPHEKIIRLKGAKDVRIFALGPPRNEAGLEDLDPQGREQFHGLALANASPGNYFAAAARGADDPAVPPAQAPLARRYSIPLHESQFHTSFGPFFTDFYGQDGDPARFARENNREYAVIPKPRHVEEVPFGRGPSEVRDNEAWRRIDNDWLYSAEQLALDMNDFTNNSSLVLAFELEQGGKVLLFAADAQRGNWISWAKKTWKDGGKTVTARDLLGRTVLYKVGHHGSHNATLDGLATDDHPNLAWLATGDYAQEFTAMITAVRAWAETQKGWDHPLASIKEALLRKASGRVFQTDKNFDDMQKPNEASRASWKRFQDRTHGDPLFFDYEITR